MDTSLIIAGAAVTVAFGGNVILAIGLVKTWRRNGQADDVKYGELKAEVRNTGEKVTHLNKMVEEIGQAVAKVVVESGRQDERLIATERDIHELKESNKGG